MSDVASDTLTLRRAFSKDEYQSEEDDECDMISVMNIIACPFEEQLAVLLEQKIPKTYFDLKEDENPFQVIEVQKIDSWDPQIEEVRSNYCSFLANDSHLSANSFRMSINMK